MINLGNIHTWVGVGFASSFYSFLIYWVSFPTSEMVLFFENHANLEDLCAMSL